MRLFFALWPDAAAVSRLAEASAEVALLTRGRPVPARKIHLTLVFLGEVDEARVEAAKRAPDGLDHPAFQVRLDQWGSFRGARVAWAGCRELSPALLSLQSDLAARLRKAGFALEERAYTPHVTLARRVSRPLEPRAAAAIGWRADEVALVRSEPGRGGYGNLRVWPLG